MATSTTTYLTDDLDGSSDDVQTVKFALHGRSYEIDLSAGNRAALEESFAEFTEHARKVSGAPARAARGSRTGGSVDSRAVRAWAAANGVEVAPRGRIRAEVVDQYRAAA